MTALAEAAPATESQPGDDHVLVLCHMLSNRISDVFEGEFAASEVTVPEWRVLLSVAGGGHTNAQAIAGRWAMNKMTVSRAIDSLVDRDLVSRSRNPLDKRVHDLGLTPAGRRLYERLIPLANRRYHELTAELSADELRQFKSTLAKLIGRADDLTR